MLAKQLLESEQTYYKALTALQRDVEGPLAVGGGVAQEDVQGVLVQVTRVMDVSRTLIEKLQAGEPVWTVVEWMRGMIGVASARYVEYYHSVLEPLLGRKYRAKVDAWAIRSGRVDGVRQLLLEFGAPVSRPAAWGFLVRRARAEADGNDDHMAKWEAFVADVDSFIATMFSKYSTQASVNRQASVTAKFAKSQPRLADSPFIHNGELTKEFARGRHVRVFYLFSDALVHFKLTPHGLNHKGMKSSRNVLPIENIVDIDADEADKCVFRITRKDSRKDMVLHCDSAEERDYWVDVIRRVMASCGEDEPTWSYESLAADGGVFATIRKTSSQLSSKLCTHSPSPTPVRRSDTRTHTPSTDVGLQSVEVESLHTTPRQRPAGEPFDPF